MEEEERRAGDEGGDDASETGGRPWPEPVQRPDRGGETEGESEDAESGEEGAICGGWRCRRGPDSATLGRHE